MERKKTFFKKWPSWPYWLSALLFLFFYGGAVDNYFFQDDFFFLRLSRLDSFWDFFKFFSPWPQQDFPAFRPLGTQVPFLIAQTLFSSWALFFLRFLAFSFHFLNFVLVEKIVFRLTKKKAFSFCLSLVYLVAPLHFLSLYYLAAFQQVLMAFFEILGFYFYLFYYRERNKKNFFIFYLVFALALLSKEMAVIFPFLLFLFAFFVKEGEGNFSFKNVWRGFKEDFFLWAGLLVELVLYVLLRFLSFAHHPGQEYQLAVTVRTLLSSWRWYLVWLLGAPETIIQYAGRGLQFSWSKFLENAGIWGYFFIASFLAESGLVCWFALRLLKTKKVRCKVLFWLVWFWVWFASSLATVSLFPYHRYSHYLDLALFGLILLTVRVGQIMNKEKISLGKRLSLFLMVLFLMNAFFSIRIDALLHWAPARADIALYYSRLFRENKEACQKGVYFTGPYSKEVATALSFADGPRYFCQNYSLPVFYQGINEPPAGQEGVLFKIRTD